MRTPRQAQAQVSHSLLSDKTKDADMAAFNTISPVTLMRRLGLPDTPALIDVRTDEDFLAAPCLIPTARRFSHTGILSVADELRDRDVVVICHKGLKLSHGAAALLRTEGIAAQILEGGMAAWREGDYPALPVCAIAPDWDGSETVWVTRHRPKIDRIACPWLIRRFIDPKARFLFVPSAQVDAVADRFDAIAFDTPNAKWTHKGESCTFDALLDGFGLTSEPLARLAVLVRAADTGRHDLSPEAAGLLAISVGLSRAYKSDLDQLAAGLTLYDALYRWARDGRDESHSWPGKHAQ